MGNIMNKFVDREREMAVLVREYEQDAASLVILYGRRRVGKTALITEFIKDKPTLYFLATEENETVNRSNFQALCADFLHDDLLKNANMTRWEDIFAWMLRNNFIDNHVGFVYEKCCREKLWQLSAEKKLPFEISRVGRWWDNKGTEIDVVALSPEKKGLVVGECKFRKGPVGLNVLNDLQDKADAIDWNREARKIYYVLFSIRGFTPELQEVAAARHDVMLVS